MKSNAKYLLTIHLVFLILTSCGRFSPDDTGNFDYRKEMRDFVIQMSSYARSFNEGFLIIPQNGQELMTDNGQANGSPEALYLQAIDASGRENLFYGYNKDDKETPLEESEFMLDLCLLCEQFSVEVLTTDYCSTPGKMDNSYHLNEQLGFISFAADDRELRNIPDYPAVPHKSNPNPIEDLSKAKNFLYLINSEHYATKQLFLEAISETNYDVLIIDLFHDEVAFTKEEVEALKTKDNGGSRLVICYMSIGEAEDYRFYWKSEWENNQPVWLESENSEWEGNYKVRYWESEWKEIIFGNKDSYLDKIIDRDFDGVYLDIIDAFEYFE